MQIEINGKRNITLDFNAPKKFRLVKDGAEIPYIRTGKNSFRLSKPVEGFVELEEIVEQPRYMQPVQLQPQQMTVINPQDVDRLNEAVRQMALVNPQDVMIINQTAEQLEKNQNFIAQTQKEITDNQVYIDQQQQRLNETALGIQALETDNSQRLDGAENAILNLAGEISNTQTMAVDGMNTALNKIEEQGILLQAEIDTKADKDELESLKKDFEEKSDRISSAMANYSGGTAYDTLPQGGEAGQILAKRTDRQGDYIWIDQTPVIVKSETIPTASEKYKGEVYQYVGETGDYTHGYIYECQQNGTSYDWVRLDVQPNTAVWGQITGTLSDQTDLQEALDDKQDKLSQTQIDAVNSGANQSNIEQITTNQTNINTINSKIPAQASSSNQLADKDWVENKGYITGITSGDVTTALGYTPYNSSNPDGYQTASDVATAISGKQDTLVSGTNIKTINGNSLLGSGDLSVSAQVSFANITGQPSDNTNLATALDAKQDIATAVNYDNITNCITYIPQDIKLELNNGTLTLKAGSKVYVPNGVGVFTESSITSDLSTTGFHDGQIMVFAQCSSLSSTSINAITEALVSNAKSGTTPEVGVYYNTSLNMIYRYTSSSAYDFRFALPIAICTRTSGTITSIDQVFNGFGYIGSTVFALPGVKGLIPNGRNAEGTLKNLEFTLSKVLTMTYLAKDTIDLNLYQGSTFGGYSSSHVYKQEKEPSGYTNMLWYNPNNNVYKYTTNSGSSWTNVELFNVGNAVIANSNGVITSLTPKTAFHAVDYNDFDNLTVSVLKKVYPVGSIYITTANTCPLSVLISGSTWELVSSGIVKAGDIPCKGNGMTLGINDGTNNFGFFSSSTSNYAMVSYATAAYGTKTGTSQSDVLQVNRFHTLGLTTDGSKSGIIADTSSLTLAVNIFERTA